MTDEQDPEIVEGMDFLFTRLLRRMRDEKGYKFKDLVKDCEYTMQEFGINELDAAMIFFDVIDVTTKSDHIKKLCDGGREMLSRCFEVDVDDEVR